MTRYLFPLFIFPIERIALNLKHVGFWVKVSRKLLTVVSCVYVHYVDRIDLIEQVLNRVRCKYRNHTRIETRAKNTCDARFCELLTITPLPIISLWYLLAFSLALVERYQF